MDRLELNEALVQAYGLDQVRRDPVEAVARLRDRLSKAGDLTVARAELKRLAEVRAARTIDERCGCIITEVTHRLLAKALEGLPDAA